MPIKGGKMTRSERMIAKAMAETGNRDYAALAAKVSPSSGAVSKALARPAVQAEIARQQTEILFSVALPAAVNCLIEIATDAKAAAGARVQASKVILDRTFGASEAMGGKEAHEMTAEEIAKAIEQLQRVAADRAKPVLELDASTIDESAQDPDIFG